MKEKATFGADFLVPEIVVDGGVVTLQVCVSALHAFRAQNVQHSRLQVSQQLHHDHLFAMQDLGHSRPGPQFRGRLLQERRRLRFSPRSDGREELRRAGKLVSLIFDAGWPDNFPMTVLGNKPVTSKPAWCGRKR